MNSQANIRDQKPRQNGPPEIPSFVDTLKSNIRGLYPGYLLQKKQVRNLAPHSSGNLNPSLFYNTAQLKIDVADYASYEEIMEQGKNQVITTISQLRLLLVCAVNQIIKMRRETHYFSEPPLQKAHPWLVVVVSDVYTLTETLELLWKLTQQTSVVVKGVFDSFKMQELQKQYIEMGADILVTSIANLKRFYEHSSLQLDALTKFVLMDVEQLRQQEFQLVLDLQAELNIQTFVYSNAEYISDITLQVVSEQLQCNFDSEIITTKLKYTHIVPIQVVENEIYKMVEDIVQNINAKQVLIVTKADEDPEHAKRVLKHSVESTEQIQQQTRAVVSRLQHCPESETAVKNTARPVFIMGQKSEASAQIQEFFTRREQVCVINQSNVELLLQSTFDIVFVLAPFDITLMNDLTRITANIVQAVTPETQLLDNAKLLKYLVKRQQQVPRWLSRQVLDDIKYQDQQQWVDEVGQFLD